MGTTSRSANSIRNRPMKPSATLGPRASSHAIASGRSRSPRPSRIWLVRAVADAALERRRSPRSQPSSISTVPTSGTPARRSPRLLSRRNPGFLQGSNAGRPGFDNVAGAVGPAAGVSWQSAGWSDGNGDGVPTPFQHSGLGEGLDSTSFKTNHHERCGSNDSHPEPYQSWQMSGFFDLNGDGRADHVYAEEGDEEWPSQPRRWYVAFNTGGARFAPTSRALHPWFALSDSDGTCNGDSQSVAGLTDLDGDGIPELVRVVNGVLHRWRLLARSTDQHSIGRLTAIRNGYGATTYIRYANAKADLVTPHKVPFPEIVVAETGTTVDDGGPGLAPVFFGYGDASLSYEPTHGAVVVPRIPAAALRNRPRGSPGCDRWHPHDDRAWRDGGRRGSVEPARDLGAGCVRTRERPTACSIPRSSPQSCSLETSARSPSPARRTSARRDRTFAVCARAARLR